MGCMTSANPKCAPLTAITVIVEKITDNEYDVQPDAVNVVARSSTVTGGAIIAIGPVFSSGGFAGHGRNLAKKSQQHRAICFRRHWV
jgi:hypothetical protein